MSEPVVVAVAPGSAAERAGLCAGDTVVSVNGFVPRDVIEWRFAVDEADLVLDVRRGGLELTVEVAKRAGEPLGAEVSSAVFDRVRTCDNHCEFCFIYQLPKGLRKSLYMKDDDYRLSFLYGNFTTLTRFTEADLERVVTERLSPLNVSIHATDPDVRSRMLKNPRGGMSLRWMRALLDHGITVRGQVVLCPGVNDGVVFERTMAGILDQYPDLHSVAVVPLGLSRYNTEPAMRLHTRAEAEAMLDAVHGWQEVFLRVLGHRMVFTADEYYLMAGRPFPSPEEYEGFHMYEDGIGMARTFEAEFLGTGAAARGDEIAHASPAAQGGFFAWVDGAPAEGYRAPRNPAGDTGLRGCHDPATGTAPLRISPRADAPVAILTAPLGARVIRPLVEAECGDRVRVVEVPNEFFGGNTSVTGLMVGADIARVLADEPPGHRYLLPDVCLSEGRFLDGTTVADLPRPVEVVPTDGRALRAALGLPALEPVA